MAGRIDFKVGSFDELIDKHGEFFTLQHAMRCPCQSPETGQPDPNCPYCKQGWQYYGDQQIQGVISSVASERQFLDTGGMLIGTMNLTVKAGVELGYRDRVISKDAIIAFSELLTRGEDAADEARFTILDTIRVVGLDGVLYKPVTDYVAADGKINWILGGSAPASGSCYSVAYRMHPSWLVLSHTHIVRDTHIKFRKPAPVHYRLPIQVICKLEYLME